MSRAWEDGLRTGSAGAVFFLFLSAMLILASVFVEIAERAGADHPHQLARQLLMLAEGAAIMAEHHRPTHAGEDALQAALALLAAAAFASR